MNASREKPARRRVRHTWLFALPAREMPAAVACDGQRYEHVQTFKHDFFAASGLYRAAERLAVLKLGRQTDFLSLPMRWLGALLTQREVRLYQQAQAIRNVPRFIGTIGETGFLHEYVRGHPLGRREIVSASFFDELATTLRCLHDRHIAYVDLNKRENILVGDDGRPYLIDFQISLYLPPTGWRRRAPVRWLLARFQHADRYHLLKHKRRLRPDLLTAQEREELAELSVWIRLHRLFARPFTALRRRTLRRLRRTQELAVTGSQVP